MFWANRWTSILRNTVQRLILIRRFFFFQLPHHLLGQEGWQARVVQRWPGGWRFRQVHCQARDEWAQRFRPVRESQEDWAIIRTVFEFSRAKETYYLCDVQIRRRAWFLKRDYRPYLVFWHLNNFFLKKKLCDPHSTLFSLNTSSIIQLEISTIIAKYSPFTAFLNYSRYKFNLPF